MKSTFATFLAVLFVSSLSAAEPRISTHQLQLVKPGRVLVADDFTQAERSNRRLTRGEWIVKDGLAVCGHDEELFKKYKNHGPAIWYDQEFKDGVVRFDFQPSKDCKHFVFTVNGQDGHVFRFVTNEAGTDVRAWNADHKSKQLAKAGPVLPQGAWTSVTVEMAGNKACVQIGDKYQVVVDDPSYAVAKNVVGFSFHYGSVKLRNFELLEAMPK
jgi:hypothetical protein